MSEWGPYAEALLQVHDLPARGLSKREGYNHHTYISSNSVVRIPRTDHSFAGEIWAMEQARNKDLPVPKILAVEEKNILMPYMLEERLKGDHITCNDITPNVSRQAGEALAKVHSVKTRNYGWIDGNGNGRYRNWKPYLEVRRKNIGEAVRLGLLDIGEITAMNKMYDHLEGLPEQKPVLLHGDFQFNNLLFQKGKLTGIVDFSPRSGPVEFDIGGVAACLNGKHFKNFEEGYGKKIDESSSLLYAIDKLVGMLVFYNEHKPSVVPKLQEKINNVIDRLYRRAA